MNTHLLTVSSKGQIALPASIRKELSIDRGTKLVAYTSGDVIMLKVVELPSYEEFEATISSEKDKQRARVVDSVIANMAMESMYLTQTEKDYLKNCFDGKMDFETAVSDVISQYIGGKDDE